MYMTSTQPDFISDSLEPWMIKERENILSSITASTGCPMQRRIKPTSERENPNVTMNENKEPKIKEPSREKKGRTKERMNKVFHPFSRIIIMVFSPLNFSLCRLNYLFVFKPRFGWIIANTIQLEGGRGWFRDSRVINAILRPVSFLLGRLIDHTRPFLIYNRAPRQMRPVLPSTLEFHRISMNDRGFSPLLFSILFLFFFLFLPFLSLLPHRIPVSGNLRGVKSEYRIRWSLSPVAARFNLLLLRTLGGSAARMKSYLRRAGPASQPLASFLVAPRRETRIIEKSSEAGDRTPANSFCN